ncbi:MAG: diguanylate cyclase [Paucibacter sp.]|nr:diguanylate cyclase [Roseateles sp.]
MAVQGFAHLNLRAPRALLDALRDFYVDAVGLAPGPRPPFNSHGYWLYAGGRDVLHLSETRPGELRVPGRSHTYDHLALACDDLAGTEARLRALGIAWRRAEVPLTGQIQLFFDDPAGNGVELNFASGQ